MLNSPVQVGRYKNGNGDIIQIIPAKDTPEVISFGAESYWSGMQYCIGFNETLQEYQSFSEYGHFHNDFDSEEEDLVDPKL